MCRKAGLLSWRKEAFNSNQVFSRQTGCVLDASVDWRGARSSARRAFNSNGVFSNHLGVILSLFVDWPSVLAVQSTLDDSFCRIAEKGAPSVDGPLDHQTQSEQVLFLTKKWMQALFAACSASLSCTAEDVGIGAHAGKTLSSVIWGDGRQKRSSGRSTQLGEKNARFLRAFSCCW